MFARMIAFRPSDHRQVVEVVSSSGLPSRVASRIGGRIDQLLGDPRAVAAAMLCPGITTLEALLRTAVALSVAQPSWQLELEPLEQSPIGDALRVRLTCNLTTRAGGQIASEVLVFGNFAEFAATRRAPLTAFELYVGTPLDIDPKTKEPPTKANLAHLDTGVSRTTFDKMWNATKASRLTSLAGIDDSRAKAKTSFVVPVSLARSCGCWE